MDKENQEIINYVKELKRKIYKAVVFNQPVFLNDKEKSVIISCLEFAIEKIEKEG